MSNEITERHPSEDEGELERAVRAAESPAEITHALARLHSAFDQRRRRGDMLALRESTRAPGQR